MSARDKKWIEDKICLIMENDGPDGHTDGSGLIAEFVDALLKGVEETWLADYQMRVEKKNREYEEFRARH